MLATFGATVLADDQNSAAGGKLAFKLSDFAFDSGVMVVPAYGGALAFKLPTGNVDGKIGILVEQSFPDLDTMLLFLKTVYGLINTTATLTLKENVTTLTFSNATLKAARRDPANSTGVRLAINYLFEINAIT